MDNNNINSICIVIPTLNPEPSFVDYVDRLIEAGFNSIIIVDDGSDYEKKYIFDDINNRHEIHFVHHSKNLGKGKSLKDAFSFYLENGLDCKNDGVITVDSDGQHSINDVLRISKYCRENKNQLVFGVRDFDLDYIPPKSRFGNKLTRRILKLFFGKDIKDTQTGLRAIPNCYIKDFIGLQGDRYEYETNMLIHCITNNIDICEMPIETVYHNNNEGTHFNPIVDSVKIYFAIFYQFIKFIISALLSFIIDYIIFCVCIGLSNNPNDKVVLMFSTIIARVISSIFNYNFNKKIVFKKNDDKYSLVKYYILCITRMFASAILLILINSLNISNVYVIKIIVETLLFIASYKFQQMIVFK